MSSFKRVAFVASAAGFAVLALAACHYGPDVRGPFQNQYIDAESGRPIEGAVFLVVWHSVTPNFVSGGSEQFVDAREAVSGPDGRVEIPVLGGVIWRIGLGRRFYEFVPGYGHARDTVQVTPTDGRPYIDATTTFMRRLRTRQERCEEAHRPLLPSSARQDQMPRYTSAVSAERDSLKCGPMDRRSLGLRGIPVKVPD